MPVSGLIVSLADREELREQAIGAMRDEPRIDVGVIQSQRMAIVIDTGSSEEDKQLWNWLQDLPGVVFVDVVMVGLEDDGGDQCVNASQVPLPAATASDLSRRER